MESKIGVVSDIHFYHKSNELVTIQDSTPTLAILYGSNLTPYYLICQDYVNKGIISPNDTYVALVGLKGLDGRILIWRLEDKELVGRAVSNGSSFIKWDHTESRFLSSIVFTKLKVDHQVNVFSITGEKLASILVKENDLMNADFIPGPYQAIEVNKIPYEKLDGSLRDQTILSP
jgi:uncharacterized protein with WD repeat